MTLTFDLRVARLNVLRPLPLGETARGARADTRSSGEAGAVEGGGWAWPWEALPLALHRCLNNGKEGQASLVAVQVYEADRVVRSIMYLVAVGVVVYMSGYGYAFDVAIDLVDAPAFPWIALGAWWAVLALQVVSQLFGRFTRNPESISASEVRDRAELHLPALYYNHQSFGLERTEGMIAAGLIAFAHLGYAGAWGLTLYICVARMAADDAYKMTWTVIWSSAITQTVLTALARSVSFSDLRASTSKPNTHPTATESVRITLVCLHIFASLCVVAPLGIAFAQLVYV